MSERVRVHMRVPGTAPMPQLMRLIQDIESAASRAPASSTAR